MERFDVELAGSVRQPQPSALDGPGSLTVPVEYSITYGSRAVADDVVLDGSFELTYDESTTRWLAPFREAMLWPGIRGADHFLIRRSWPRRGRILDRFGRVLAAGGGLRRRYPYGSLAGTTVGFTAPLTRKSMRDAPGDYYRTGDLAGATGLERAYERRLAGTPRVDLAVADRRGKPIVVLATKGGRRPRDVRTTLDMRVQRATAGAFGSTSGGVVVVKPRTGDLLAVVTSLEIDPNNYAGAGGIDPFNRALAGLYPPGSAMKVVTAGAALDSGAVTPRTRLTGPSEYQGVRNFESGSYPSLTFASALQNSVNTAFAQVALDLGARRLSRYARAFGFNEPPEMALGAATSSFPFPEDAGDLMWGSIGQAQDLATPLEMASIAATVANNGTRMEPRSARHEPKRGERVLKKRTARTLGGLMESVVQGGTGVNAQIGGVRVAGKTGTAEVDVDGKRRNHAWFIAFAPVGAPEVAVAVVSEYGGIGGQVAAPIARSILAGVLPITR